MAQQYKVISDRCTLGSVGAIVNESELEGVNFQALLDGGHLEAVSKKEDAPKQSETKEK
jgi:hypothetical protein